MIFPESIVIELHYLPSVSYFVHLSAFKQVYIDIGELYIKQSYRNRCRINGANKIENLIVPVKGRNHKNKFKDKVVDYKQKWLNNHMRALQSAYGKAPFFEYYSQEIFEIFLQRPLKLLELNQALLTKCLEFLDLQIDLKFVDNIDKFLGKECYNAKNIIHPKKILPNNEIYNPQNYFQVFGKNFVPNLSVIDLIFCEGPSAGQIITKSNLLKSQFDK